MGEGMEVKAARFTLHASLFRLIILIIIIIIMVPAGGCRPWISSRPSSWIWGGRLYMGEGWREWR